MGVVQSSIGLRWENILQEEYKDSRSTAGDDRVPDFHHPSGFWIEAKVGNVGWGCRLKQYQLDQIGNLKEPVVYGLGMHNFDKARKRLKQKTEWGRQRNLERNMEIVEAYFVSGEIVKKFFEKEVKVSGRGQLCWQWKVGNKWITNFDPGSMKYCMVKSSALRNIIFDRPFRRMDKRIKSSAEYYNFNRDDFIIDVEDGFGYILHTKREAGVYEYLKKGNPLYDLKRNP
jgi:hypothetical protein